MHRILRRTLRQRGRGKGRPRQKCRAKRKWPEDDGQADNARPFALRFTQSADDTLPSPFLLKKFSYHVQVFLSLFWFRLLQMLSLL